MKSSVTIMYKWDKVKIAMEMYDYNI